MKLINTKFDLIEAIGDSWIDGKALALVITKEDIKKNRNFFNDIQHSFGILLTNPEAVDDLEERLMVALQKLCSQLGAGQDLSGDVQP